MAKEVAIARRFRGPPESGNGGYSCGVTAIALSDAPARVTLRLPPPLERPLRVEPRDGGVVLLDGEIVVSEAQPADVNLAAPEAPDFSSALQAADAFDAETYKAKHVFPECFTCGPARAEGDGLRVFAGRDPRSGMVLWPWTPDDSVAEGGRVRPEIIWAALDCPSAMAWMESEDWALAVLGRMTARVERLPRTGERLVVGAWPDRAEGRKLISGSAVWDEHGDLVACNEAIWVKLTDEQKASFRAVNS